MVANSTSDAAEVLIAKVMALIRTEVLVDTSLAELCADPFRASRSRDHGHAVEDIKTARGSQAKAQFGIGGPRAISETPSIRSRRRPQCPMTGAHVGCLGRQFSSGEAADLVAALAGPREFAAGFANAAYRP